MAWSTPPSWSAGNVVTSAKLTIVSDDLSVLHDGAYEAWSSYTPTVKLGTTTVTIANNQSVKTLYGKLQVVRYAFRFSNLNSGTGSLSLSLPNTARSLGSGFDLSAFMPVGQVTLADRSAIAQYSAYAKLQTTTTLIPVSLASPAVDWSNTAPVTIAAGAQGTGDELFALVIYEIA